MQIAGNTTGFVTNLFVATDKEGRDHCVVVVKGTFRAAAGGALAPCEEQRPLVTADEHYGEPGVSAVRYASDCVLGKPLMDLVVVGKAVAPAGRPVRDLTVRLEVQGRAKELLVLGDRRWVRAGGNLIPSHPPVPFVEMPLTFDRAFGGQDDSGGPGQVAVDRRNLVGVGFHAQRPPRAIEGTALPNLEDPRQRIRSPKDRPPPAGFGALAPASEARARWAGTYDQRWRDDVAPLLPADFDPRYFQCAPEDQRFPPFTGGELIRCLHMASDPVVEYLMPAVEVPVDFRFADRQERRLAMLDTVTLEPDRALAILVWRASAPLPKKLHLLQEVFVGEAPVPPAEDQPRAHRAGKPVFAGLGAATRALRKSGR